MGENVNREVKYLDFYDLEVYKAAFALSNYVWQVVALWNNFAKDTVGKQFVRAVDSISANIAEGYGRNTRNDKIRFYVISAGSIKESLDWLNKANSRALITSDEYAYMNAILQRMPRMINQQIKYTRDHLKH